MAPAQVRDFMVTEVVTLEPGDSIEHAVAVLLDHDVGGAPVVDTQGRLVGLLSDSDLMVRQGRLHVPPVFTLFFERAGLLVSSSSSSLRAFERELQKALGSTVGEVMERDPPVCLPSETAEEVATRMLERSARRLPVVDDEGRLVGIVARGDLLRLLTRP